MAACPLGPIERALGARQGRVPLSAERVGRRIGGDHAASTVAAADERRRCVSHVPRLAWRVRKSVVASLDELLSSTLLTRLQALIAEEPDAVVGLIDAEFRAVWADEAGALDVYGRVPSDYEGRPAADFLDPTQVPCFESAVRAALAGETARFEGRVTAGDGNWRFVRTVMWPTVDRQHVVTVSVVVDLPEDS
jgi:hypothetical protein